jgi:hypothetical protein
MAEWERRASLIDEDVVFFEYVTSKLARQSELVFIWDLDKTYLDTSWHTVKELLRTAFEKALQKKNIPGTSTLVRALTSSRSETEFTLPFPIYFVTASPPQMEKKIRKKLELDGVMPYGIFFRDNLRNLRPGHFWRLNKQIGFKLQALLDLRLRLSEKVQLILWGDDSESDAIIYSLYSDLCARRTKDSKMRNWLEKFYVTGTQLEHIFELRNLTPAMDPVKKIYINLATDTDPEYYSKFGRRVLATYNTFQVALDLFQDDRLKQEQLIRVAQDLVLNYNFTVDELAESVNDLWARSILDHQTVERASSLLVKESLLPEYFRVQKSLISKSSFESQSPEWIPDEIDYLGESR